jgi:hypothetical protein
MIHSFAYPVSLEIERGTPTSDAPESPLPEWLTRVLRDAATILKLMVDDRDRGRRNGWTMGEIQKRVYSDGIKARERITAPLAKLNASGLIHIEGDRIDNTHFFPTERANRAAIERLQMGLELPQATSPAPEGGPHA